MMFRPRHLWWRIWLAVLASIVVFAFLAGLAWRTFFDPARVGQNADVLAETIAEQLPPADAARTQIQDFLELQHQRSGVDLALFDDDGAALAVAGRPVPPPRAGETESHWLILRHPPHMGLDGAPRPARPAFALRLPQSRWLVVRREAGNFHAPPFGLLWMLAFIAIAVGVGTYPIARRLTRRLERLQVKVDQLGAGDLSARVEVEGHDEVGRLAERFNHAAARIEALVLAQKSLLANASHELRSPLARIRMAAEMLGERPNVELLREVRRNVGELDELVEEILLASRLDSSNAPLTVEDVDLTALAAEECAHADAMLDAVPTNLQGDARLLRRLLRNLIDNAQRYGAGTPIEVHVSGTADAARIEVCDRGPGIAESERERVFEPFYRAVGGSERDGGVGLGLSLVRQIARRHGGDVRCVARQGGGACFIAELPLRPPRDGGSTRAR